MHQDLDKRFLSSYLALRSAGDRVSLTYAPSFLFRDKKGNREPSISHYNARLHICINPLSCREVLNQPNN